MVDGWSLGRAQFGGKLPIARLRERVIRHAREGMP
jgi:hypothetical protein